MDGKTKAIIAHITPIGWIIAFVMNNSEKDSLASYYIRQTLGIWIFMILARLASLLVAIISAKLAGLIYLILAVAGLVLWVISLLGALSGEEKPVPIIGEQIQGMFKGIS